MIDIEDYAKILGIQLEFSYYHYQNKRITAKFPYCEVKEGTMLRSAYGDSEGLDPDAAIEDYVNQIKGKTIVIRAYTPERKQYVVPENLTYTKK